MLGNTRRCRLGPGRTQGTKDMYAMDSGLGESPFRLALERRLRERAERADDEVQLTPDTLHRWMQEEIHAIRREAAFYKALARYRHTN